MTLLLLLRNCYNFVIKLINHLLSYSICSFGTKGVADDAGIVSQIHLKSHIYRHTCLI